MIQSRAPYLHSCMVGQIEQKILSWKIDFLNSYLMDETEDTERKKNLESYL